MKKIIFLMTIFLCQSLFSQHKYNIVVDSVKVNFSIEYKEKIEETVVVKNLSNKSIFLPDIDKKELFYFCLGNRLYSNLGIMNSMTGAPNLGGSIKLIEVKPQKEYRFKVVVNKDKPIEFYSFGLDFLKGKNKNIFNEKNKFFINTSDYISLKKSFYFKQE